MKIIACPKCGSKEIYQGTMGDGVLTGYSTRDVCKNCGYQGNPIVFQSEKDYTLFLNKTKQEKKDKQPVKPKKDNLIDLPQKDKEIVELLKEYEREKPRKPIWPNKKVWWPEIIISLVLAFLIYLTGISGFAKLMGLAFAILYGIFGFLIDFIVILVILVVLEYFLLSLKNIISK